MSKRRSSASKPKTSPLKASVSQPSMTKAATTPRPASQPKPAPEVVSETAPRSTSPELKKKELVDLVTERSDVKKKFAKPVVEAMIDILGEAIAEGRELNLQPLGKLKHQRTKETANARITVAKIRQSKSASPASDHTDASDKPNEKESVADPVK